MFAFLLVSKDMRAVAVSQLGVCNLIDYTSGNVVSWTLHFNVILFVFPGSCEPAIIIV